MTNNCECVVCSPQVTPGSATTFCVFHRRIRTYYARNHLMTEAVRQASFGERTDFPGNDYSHVWHQLAGTRKKGHWVVELDDILRAYGVHHERERPDDGSEAA